LDDFEMGRLAQDDDEVASADGQLLAQECHQGDIAVPSTGEAARWTDRRSVHPT